eukprot:scaffold15081_cov123-Isochrysis_galbana.AAC.1
MDRHHYGLFRRGRLWLPAVEGTINKGERPDLHAPPWGHALETARTPERWSGRERSVDWEVEG